jgi:hypothetical protein
MNRRAIGLVAAAVIAVVVGLIIIVFPKHASKKPALLPSPSPSPSFTIKTANDLYTAETRLGAINLERYAANQTALDEALKQF